ncbi:MAG TPA: hypothetical protein VML95_08990 [Longimicrobiales bacterium]|nr:hypothetical protein [Longimicrobiales bacterium]
MTRRNLVLMLAAAGLVWSAEGVSAQDTRIDDGTFRLLVGGREVGRETFSIRRAGEGDAAVTIAQGRVVRSDPGAAGEVTSNLQVNGPALRPSSYQLEVRGDERERITGRVTGGRFSARITSSAGEMMREYLAGEGAVVIDDGIAHHHYFIAGRGAAGDFSVPVIVPRRSRQISASVRNAGRASVEAGGSTVNATHLVVEFSEGPLRHVYVDGSGRLLRVEIPDLNFAAVRVDLP